MQCNNTFQTLQLYLLLHSPSPSSCGPWWQYFLRKLQSPFPFSFYFVPSIFSQCILSPIKTQSSSNMVNVAPPSPALLLPLTVLFTLPLLALLIMWSSLRHQLQLERQDASSFLLWSLYLLWYTRNTKKKHRNQSKLLQRTVSRPMITEANYIQHSSIQFKLHTEFVHYTNKPVMQFHPNWHIYQAFSTGSPARIATSSNTAIK